ncbi:hypothetical protein E4U19_003236 [Claviceps sp. Clav32 group G5]|nr:hypothetical protein E4U19_003236 [Claviceps sp. Clav32 group G5]
MKGEKILADVVFEIDFVKKAEHAGGHQLGSKSPTSVKERAHLLSTCRALTQYDASIFPVDRRPCHVAVVWARHGHDNRQDAPPAAMGRPRLGIGKTLADMTLSEFELYFSSWFYDRKEQFGMNG